MKTWLLEKLLPMWALETLYKDLRRARSLNRSLRDRNRALRAYIRGLEQGKYKEAGT